MTTTITTASELYACCSDFAAMIELWRIERRCPLPMVDLLLEWGLESQAEAARWAATERLREPYKMHYPTEAPYPCEYTGVGTTDWYWICVKGIDTSDSLPPDHFACAFGHHESKQPTFDKAIVWMLDRWRV